MANGKNNHQDTEMKPADLLKHIKKPEIPPYQRLLFYDTTRESLKKKVESGQTTQHVLDKYDESAEEVRKGMTSEERKNYETLSRDYTQNILAYRNFLEIKLKEVESSGQEKDNIIADLTGKHRKLYELNDQLIKEKTDLTSQLEEAEQDEKKSIDDYNALSEELAEALKKSDAVSRELDTTKNEYKSLSEKYEALMQKSPEVSSEVELMKRSGTDPVVTRIQEENEYLTKLLSQKEDEIKEVKKTAMDATVGIDAYENVARGARIECEQERTKYEEMRTKYEQMRPKYEELRIEYEQLKSKFEQLEKDKVCVIEPPKEVPKEPQNQFQLNEDLEADEDPYPLQHPKRME